MNDSPVPPDVAAWHREAERALNRRDYRRAHELCLRILAARPDFADAFFLLAMVAAEHRNFGKALELIDRASSLAPGRSDYHAQRGRCLVALRRPGEAYEAARRALELGPSDALTLDTIGVVMTHAGAHAEAVEPFRLATALDPGKASFQYNLGAALQFVGDFAAAAGAYRRALAADPDHHRAWSALAQVARSPFTAAEADELAGRLARGGLDPEAELHLRHALAKHLEDQGRYAEAFEHLERGKRRRRASLGYSFATDQALFAAARRAVPEGGPGHPSREPIFVVGMPRTGTTLVERILSSHPDVLSAGELTDLALVVKRAAASPSNRVLDEDTLTAAARIDPAMLGEAYVESTRPRTGRAPRFVDKMPLNFFYAGLISRALPNAKIVCLRRDPLDACLSNYRQLFATAFGYYHYAYDLLDTGRYYVEFDALARHWRACLGSSWLEVRYEDVVQHTEREVRRLLDFCGLEWHAACLEFERNAAPVATASAVQVREPIYHTAVGRWRNYEREIEPLRELLRRAGLI